MTEHRILPAPYAAVSWIALNVLVGLHIYFAIRYIPHPFLQSCQEKVDFTYFTPLTLWTWWSCGSFCFPRHMKTMPGFIVIVMLGIFMRVGGSTSSGALAFWSLLAPFPRHPNLGYFLRHVSLSTSERNSG